MLKFNIIPPQLPGKEFPNRSAENVNRWKPKQVQPPSPSWPPHLRLHEAFHTLQSHVSSFLQKPQNLFNLNKRKNLAMSNQEIGDQLSMTPVYGVKVSCDEPIKILPMDQRKSILGYFFSKADAMGFAEYMKRSSIPSRENFVVSEALDDVMEYHIEDGPVMLIPEAYEVKNALQVKMKNGYQDETFSGIPVFELSNLSLCDHYLRLTDEGCLNQRRPVFFKKEDLEKSYVKARAASHGEKSKLIDIEAHIKVFALEDIIQSMKDNSTSEWNNVFFAYPGEDIQTSLSPQRRGRGLTV